MVLHSREYHSRRSFPADSANFSIKVYSVREETYVNICGVYGEIAGTLTKDAVRFKGSDNNLYLVAEVTEGGSVTKGQEIGVTVTYRYRQVAY